MLTGFGVVACFTCPVAAPLFFAGAAALGYASAAMQVEMDGGELTPENGLGLALNVAGHMSGPVGVIGMFTISMPNSSFK